MANVIEVPNLADQNAYYVWAGGHGPQWGTRRSFAEADMVREPFPDHDWRKAIDAASAEADREGVATVYVVRNAEIVSDDDERRTGVMVTLANLRDKLSAKLHDEGSANDR